MGGKMAAQEILIIEDEEKIARFVELELGYEGYQVTKATDGRRGLELLKAASFDLVLLDIMLPGLNGMEVLRRLRQFSQVPVIMLTARDAVVDKVTGLDSGADDYITKPFAIEELLARIRSALRKQATAAVPPGAASSGGHSLLTAGLLRLDPVGRACWVGDSPVELTKKEFDLLACLLSNKNMVLQRETLLEKIWGFAFDGNTNTVDVHIRYLRAKIEEPFACKFIHTLRGVGYVLRDEGL